MLPHHNHPPHVIYFMIASLWDDQHFHLARHLAGVDTCLQHLLRFVLPKSLPVSPALPASLPANARKYQAVTCISSTPACNIAQKFTCVTCLPASLPGLHLDFARVACKCQAATCVNANCHKYHLRVCDT